MLEKCEKEICTTRHFCPQVEKFVQRKPKFLGFVPKTCGFDYKGHRFLFLVKIASNQYLLYANSVENAARTIDMAMEYA